jgi:phage N-6-adenine-methyltransferase
MSLIGFTPTNHPQQVKKRGATDRVDERITPERIYRPYADRYGFTLDAAANKQNAKCHSFYDLEADGLTKPWAPHVVWCNPPYSNLGAWLAKAHAEFKAGCPAVVMLLPANRTEQVWWQEHVEPFRDKGGFMRTEFIRSRFNFGQPGNEGAKFNSSPPFGCVVVIFERAA